ncbi:hypothetical protein [Streptomyces sp. NBC_00648]|uniref:hypothetical protein n=1 Tax=Streptomyces sp. NBC_00648 TaxID=2975797 RepID=UPI002F90FA0F
MIRISRLPWEAETETEAEPEPEAEAPQDREPPPREPSYREPLPPVPPYRPDGPAPVPLNGRRPARLERPTGPERPSAAEWPSDPEWPAGPERRPTGLVPVPPVPDPVRLPRIRAAEPEVVRRMPSPVLLAGPAGPAALDLGGAGPSVSDCLYWLYRIKQLVHFAEDLHARLRGVSMPAHQGGDRRGGDLLRACGAGTAHAAQVLAAAIQEAVPTPGRLPRPRPQQAPIAHRAWVEAVCSVHAEHAICRELVARAPQHQLVHGITELAHRAEQEFRKMAGTPSFASWYERADPLYRSWIGGTLRGTAQPPALFPDRTALYRARPELATGWDLDGSAERGGDGLPLGSLERYVSDERGDVWAIVLAAPGHVDDPRDWPEPSGAVIAAHTGPGQPPTRCYLLADSIVPRQALTLIGPGQGRDQLEHVASSVAALRYPPSILSREERP